MARPQLDPQDPRVREMLRTLFGDRADGLLNDIAQVNASRSVLPGPVPRDAGKFFRQFAALYCDNTGPGAIARARVASILQNAMELVNLIAESNPEETPQR